MNRRALSIAFSVARTPTFIRQRAAVNGAEQSYFTERLAYILAAEELRRILGRALQSEFYKTP